MLFFLYHAIIILVNNKSKYKEYIFNVLQNNSLEENLNLLRSYIKNIKFVLRDYHLIKKTKND